MAESKEFYYVKWYKWDSEEQDYNVCESTYHYDTFEEAKKYYDKLVCDADKPQIEIHKETLEGTDWRWGKCVEDRRVLMKESMEYGVEETIIGLIRCKDCLYRHDSLMCSMYSEGMDTPDDWFCADGKVRDFNED